MIPNADEPLDVPTYVVGSDEAVHPSVVDFETAWNGYRYWMAFTPYPNGDNAYENPSVAASNDGDTWVVPEGITNPLEPQPASGYWSDPHLVPHDGTLHMFFRGVGVPGASGEIITHRSSTNGVTWTDKTTVLTLDPFTQRCLSPAVIRGDDGTWRMWTVDIVTEPYAVYAHTAPDPTGPFTDGTRCQLPAPDGQSLWHIDVRARDGDYWMLLQVGSSTGSSGVLYLASSSDGLTWNRSNRLFLGKRGNKWDAALYRASFLPVGDRSWDVWYGASTPDWRIGRAQVTPEIV